MDTSRNDLLGEIAADAALERSDFLVQATDQFRRFLDANRVADRRARRPDAHRRGPRLPLDRARPHVPQPDPLHRRSDRRVDERDRGHRDGRRDRRAVQPVRPLHGVRRGRARRGGPRPGADGRAPTCSRAPASASTSRCRRAAPTRTRPRPTTGRPASRPPLDADDDELAAQRLYDLALEYQERSQRSEARLLEQFEEAAGLLTGRIGDLIITDDDDERLTLTAAGAFAAEVLTEEENEWRRLGSADELVEYYDPTDVFGDLADALAEAYPAIAPELAARRRDERHRRRRRGGARRRRRRCEDDDEAEADGEGEPRA